MIERAMKLGRTRIRAAALAAVSALGGCAVGPTYRAPVPVMDAAFVNAGTERVDVKAPSADLATFWRGFGDAPLSALVERALAANGDVRVASARLQEARALLQGAQAEALPSVGVGADVTRGLSPQYQFPGASRSQRTGTVYDAGFTATWELDLFGRVLRSAESASAQLDASAAGVAAAQTSVSAEVARNYLELRGAQERYAVASESLTNQRQTLRLTQVRFDAGRGTRLDVARAQSLLDSTEAALPALQAAVERSAFRLATLSAQPPRAVLQALAVAQPLPSLPVTDLATLPIGTPEQLLRRRPDIVAAERQLASATAQIGVATADLFPRISLSGLLGLATDRFGDFGERGSQRAALGAGLTWPLLDFGRVRSRIGASEARAQQSLAGYEQTVAVALEETESALSQFTRSAQQAERLAGAVANAQDAERLSRLRFDAGVVDLLIVLDAQRQTLQARDALASARTAQASALVAVYRALGGGWSAPDVAVVAGR